MFTLVDGCDHRVFSIDLNGWELYNSQNPKLVIIFQDVLSAFFFFFVGQICAQVYRRSRKNPDLKRIRIVIARVERRREHAEIRAQVLTYNNNNNRRRRRRRRRNSVIYHTAEEVFASPSILQ